MTNELKPIRFQAEVIGVKTMASGSIRIIVEAQEQRTDLLQQFADVRRGGALLEVAALPIKPEAIKEFDENNFTDFLDFE